MPPTLYVHFTPTSASRLNQVERWFATTLTQKQIRRGTHRSTQQLEDPIRQYLNTYNENPKPFIWTKTADDISPPLSDFVCGFLTQNTRLKRYKVVEKRE